MERLWKLVQRGGDDECWLWKGSDGNGTRAPTISVNGTQKVAYRLVFEDAYGEIDSSTWVMHSCDNSRCMNPKHMYTGDRIAWAQKWHGVKYDEKHHEVLKQKLRDRGNARYQTHGAQIRIANAEHQMRNKIRAVNYLGGKCMRCGFDHPSALQFHHRDPSTKTFSVTSKELSTPRKRPWDTVIIPELDKCDLLCANCHFLEHGVLSPARVNELKEENR